MKRRNTEEFSERGMKTLLRNEVLKVLSFIDKNKVIILGKSILDAIPGKISKKRGRTFKYPAKMHPPLACERSFADKAR